jgi:hypothetical protein
MSSLIILTIVPKIRLSVQATNGKPVGSIRQWVVGAKNATGA